MLVLDKVCWATCQRNFPLYARYYLELGRGWSDYSLVRIVDISSLFGDRKHSVNSSRTAWILNWFMNDLSNCVELGRCPVF